MTQALRDHVEELLHELGEQEFRHQVEMGRFTKEKDKYAKELLSELEKARHGQRHQDTMTRMDEANRTARRTNWIAIGAAIVAFIAIVISVIP